METLAGAPLPDDSDIRWGVHRQMWRSSPLRKVRACRRYAHDPDAETLPVRITPRGDNGVDVGVGGLKTCASWHSCLVCGTKIAVRRAAELDHVFRIWKHLGGSVVLATFTLQHHRGDGLERLVRAQRAAWDDVVSDRPWKNDLEVLQVARFDRPDSDRKVRGVIRAFEATRGDEHGWHPHYHAFFLAHGHLTNDDAREALRPAWDRWCAGLATMGMRAVAEVGGESAGFDVRVIHSGEESTWARYPFKLALEAVGGVFKRGREVDADGNRVGKRHRTPFEVMEHYAVAVADGRADDALAERDLSIIEEWSRVASDMRFRQCPLPPGMRAVFAQLAAEHNIPGPLLEAEMTDEEIADAEPEAAETVGDMSRRQWETTVAYELDTLRETGRTLGLTGVVDWFDRRGLRFELTASGVHRLAHERRYPPPKAVVAVIRNGRRAPV